MLFVSDLDAVIWSPDLYFLCLAVWYLQMFLIERAGRGAGIVGNSRGLIKDMASFHPSHSSIDILTNIPESLLTKLHLYIDNY